jgi:hypothetical protein
MIVLLLLDNDSSKLEEINNSLLHINNGKGVISFRIGSTKYVVLILRSSDCPDNI